MQRLPHSRSQHRALRRDKRTLAYFPSGHESRGWLPWPWQNLKFGTRRGQVGSRFWQNPRFGTPISANFGGLVPGIRRNAWSREARRAFSGTKPRDSPKGGYQTSDPASKRYRTARFRQHFSFSRYQTSDFGSSIFLHRVPNRPSCPDASKERHQTSQACTNDCRLRASTHA